MKANGKGNIKRNCLIICNGDFSKKLLEKFKPHNKPSKTFITIACDGAANLLKKYSFIPDYITGDFDSITPESLTFFKNKNVIIKKNKNQNKNDLAKAFDLAIMLRLKNVFVIGYSGNRIDHTLNNFSILKKYSNKSNIKFIDDEFEIFYAGKISEFDYKKDEVVSLMGLPEASKIKTKGLKYQLKNEKLKFGKREGALNVSTGNHVKIKKGKGSLLVFKKHFRENCR